MMEMKESSVMVELMEYSVMIDMKESCLISVDRDEGIQSNISADRDEEVQSHISAADGDEGVHHEGNINGALVGIGCRCCVACLLPGWCSDFTERRP